MNKIIGFVVNPASAGPWVVAVRQSKKGKGYTHVRYSKPTQATLGRLSTLTYQKEYRMTMTPMVSFHISRNFLLPLYS